MDPTILSFRKKNPSSISNSNNKTHKKIHFQERNEIKSHTVTIMSPQEAWGGILKTSCAKS